MRLDDNVNKCVVFLGREQGDDISLAGTAFFLKDYDGTDSVTYLVTSGHVARGLVGKIGIRFNSTAGQFRVCGVDWPDWVYHPDENVDLAAMVFEPPHWADVIPLPVGAFATGFKIGTKNFGAGDFAYVVGLFRLLKSTRQNIPLVHTGHIAAMMGDQPIPMLDPHTRQERQARGYLVESRAISGASGSPVFVRRSIKHNIRDPAAPNTDLNAYTPGSVWLLGVWQGSWPQEADQALIEGAGLHKDAKVSVGIGLVVPAPFMQQLFVSPDMQAQRDRLKKSFAEKSGANREKSSG